MLDIKLTFLKVNFQTGIIANENQEKNCRAEQKSQQKRSGRGLITIDITDQNVKIAHINGRSPEQLVLENYKIFPLPQGYIQDGKINNEEQLVAILQQAYTQFKNGSKQFVAALPQILWLYSHLIM